MLPARFKPWPGPVCCNFGKDTIHSQCLFPLRSIDKLRGGMGACFELASPFRGNYTSQHFYMPHATETGVKLLHLLSFILSTSHFHKQGTFFFVGAILETTKLKSFWKGILLSVQFASGLGRRLERFHLHWFCKTSLIYRHVIRFIHSSFQQFLTGRRQDPIPKIQLSRIPSPVLPLPY